MRYGIAMVAMLFVFGTGTAWALFEADKKELLTSAKIDLVDAVKTAKESAEGTVVEAELEQEDGKTAFEVKLIDEQGKKREVYVDAETGNVIKIEEE